MSWRSFVATRDGDRLDSENGQRIVEALALHQPPGHQGHRAGREHEAAVDHAPQQRTGPRGGVVEDRFGIDNPITAWWTMT